MPADLNYRKKLNNTKKWLDIVVYTSSGLDAAIAIVALLSFFHIGNPTAYIWPISYALAAMVGLTVILGVLLIWMRHYERILYNMTMFHTQAKRTFNILYKLHKIENKFRYGYSYNYRGPLYFLKNLITKNFGTNKRFG